MDHNLTSRGTERVRKEYESKDTGWSKEHMDILITGWKNGDSMSAIGNAVGRSRNAVAGQITKLRNKGVDLARRLAGKSTRKPVRQLVPSKPRAAKVLPMPADKPRIRLKIVELPTAVTLLELQPHQCKFPLGDPKRSDFRFCGATPRMENKPYCEKHTILTEQKSYHAARGKLNPSSASSSS